MKKTKMFDTRPQTEEGDNENKISTPKTSNKLKQRRKNVRHKPQNEKECLTLDPR